MRRRAIAWAALAMLAGCAAEPRRETGRTPLWYRVGGATSGDEWWIYNAEIVRLGHARHARWLEILERGAPRTNLLVAFDCDAGTFHVDSTGAVVSGDAIPWRYPAPRSMIQAAQQVACRHAD